MTYPKLPKAFKTRWVKALRSGKYKQGQNQLKQTELDDDTLKKITTYCCLGVAAEILGCKIGQQGTIPAKGKTFEKVPEILRGDSGANNPVVDKLVDMNDGCFPVKAKTFKGIATWIDKNL